MKLKRKIITCILLLMTLSLNQFACDQNVDNTSNMTLSAGQENPSLNMSISGSETETAQNDMEMNQIGPTIIQNDMTVLEADIGIDELDELVLNFDSGTSTEQDASLPPTLNEFCVPLEINLIMRQIEQPCADCSIWFWSMGVPENRARLELEYRDSTGVHVAQFQAGPLGTHGDLWTARILGENPYWGPGSCDVNNAECPRDFLHHMQARGTFDGAPLWHGILYGDLSILPCEAMITRAHLHLHINEDEGLANADHSSIVALHRGLRVWNPSLVNGHRYDRNENNYTDLTWENLGGDFGELVMHLEAQRDFWDRGFHKANPRAWFDVTSHLIDLQAERLASTP
jgi:hypothetical protein